MGRYGLTTGNVDGVKQMIIHGIASKFNEVSITKYLEVCSSDVSSIGCVESESLATIIKHPDVAPGGPLGHWDGNTVVLPNRPRIQSSVLVL